MMRGVSGVSGKVGVPAEWLRSVAVFPLPRAVFFPGTSLPLHLFEPRYRRMMADCLAQERRVMAIAHLQPGYESDYQGSPPIHRVCGLGRIESHEALPDGRYNLVLTGIGRVYVEELLGDDLPYRRAHATVLEDAGPHEVRRENMQALVSTATQVASMIRRRYPHFELGIGEDGPPGHVADTLADRLIADPALRQELLEELHVPTRISLLTDRVAELWAQLSHSNEPDKNTVH